MRKTANKVFLLFGVLLFIFTLGTISTSVQAATICSSKTVTYNGKTIDMSVSGATGYASSDTAVGTISSKGIVTPKKAGTTKITYTKGGQAYQVKLKIKKVKPVLKLNVSTLTLDAGSGETYQLKVSSSIPGLKYKYLSYKKSVAKVSSKGKITALKSGKVTIAVYSDRTNLTYKAKRVKVKVNVVGAKVETSPTVDTYIPKSNETYNMKVYSGKKTVKAFLKTAWVISKTMVNDGNWKYSTNGKINQHSFALARNYKIRTTSCAIGVSYAMQQFGTLPIECRITAGKSTNPSKIMIYPKNSAKKKAILKYIKKYYDVIDFKGGKAISEVDADGQLKPGDVVCYPGHMNIYVGHNKSKGIARCNYRTYYDYGSKGYKDVLTTRDIGKKVVRIYRLKNQ